MLLLLIQSAFGQTIPFSRSPQCSSPIFSFAKPSSSKICQRLWQSPAFCPIPAGTPIEAPVAPLCRVNQNRLDRETPWPRLTPPRNSASASTASFCCWPPTDCCCCCCFSIIIFAIIAIRSPLSVAFLASQPAFVGCVESRKKGRVEGWIQRH